jgi:hypothetical protein
MRGAYLSELGKGNTFRGVGVSVHKHTETFASIITEYRPLALWLPAIFKRFIMAFLLWSSFVVEAGKSANAYPLNSPSPRNPPKSISTKPISILIQNLSSPPRSLKKLEF